MKTNAIIGIYKIQCLVDNKIYIGKSTDVMDRWRCHIKDLNNSKHHSVYLQNAWDKYGEESFKFEMLENCHPELLKEKEDFWLEYYKSADSDYGFNREGSNGKKSKETIQLLRLKLKGKKLKENRKIHHGRKVYQYTLSGELVKEWKCTFDVFKNIKISRDMLSRACIRKVPASGFLWSYENIKPSVYQTKGKKTIIYTENNQTLYFSSGVKAAEHFNVCHTTIYTWLNKEVKNIPLQGRLEYFQ